MWLRGRWFRLGKMGWKTEAETELHRWRRLFIAIVLIGSSLEEAAAGSPEAQVKALQAFRSSTQSPSPLVSWIGDDPCDGWEGVTCDEATDNIIRLSLPHRNLSGNIPNEIGDLYTLTDLDLQGNQLEGDIPDRLWSLALLKQLQLTDNMLTGSIPKTIKVMTALDRLSLDENRLSGPLPAELGSLANAEHFHLNNNSFVGEIPTAICNAQKLIHLLLDFNNLSGNIPDCIGDLNALQIMKMNNNNFSGSLPESVSSLRNLYELNLASNNLEGAVPALQNFVKLRYLDLSFNNFTGKLPQTTVSFPETLMTINLENNSNLGGLIPPPLLRLLSLQSLLLSNDGLIGPIPGDPTSDPKSLARLYLENNDLNGTVPLYLVVGSKAAPPGNLDLRLAGNVQLCDSHQDVGTACSPLSSTVAGVMPPSSAPPSSPFLNGTNATNINSCPCDSQSGQRQNPVMASDNLCGCSYPILLTIRLQSPPFLIFQGRLQDLFKERLSKELELRSIQFVITGEQFQGSRLAIDLEIFPADDLPFTETVVETISSKLYNQEVHLGADFGPYVVRSFMQPKDVVIDKPKQGKTSGKLSIGVIAGIAVGGSGLIGLAFALGLYAYFQRKRLEEMESGKSSKKRIVSVNHGQSSSSSGQSKGSSRSLWSSGSKRGAAAASPIPTSPVRSFSFSELKVATDNFSDGNQLGKGAYGRVYKAHLRNGDLVAAKRAERMSLQRENEFITEVSFLMRIHHKNLVQLLGYCIDSDEQILVYEYLDNGNLRDHLSRKHPRPPLTWLERLRIAIGSASALQYLHVHANPPIIHRDVKSNNILLDKNMVAKVSDLGLSKLLPELGSEELLQTEVRGTVGYMAPEYTMTKQLTEKTDVYSFGVVLLELCTGRMPITRGRHVLQEVQAGIARGTLADLLDVSMTGTYDPASMRKVIDLALRCLNVDMYARPTMTDVVRELQEIPQPQLLPLSPKRSPKSSAHLSRPSPRSTAYQTSDAQSAPQSTLQSLRSRGQSNQQGRSLNHSDYANSFTDVTMVEQPISMIIPR